MDSTIRTDKTIVELVDYANKTYLAGELTDPSRRYLTGYNVLSGAVEGSELEGICKGQGIDIKVWTDGKDIGLKCLLADNHEIGRFLRASAPSNMPVFLEGIVAKHSRVNVDGRNRMILNRLEVAAPNSSPMLFFPYAELVRIVESMILAQMQYLIDSLNVVTVIAGSMTKEEEQSLWYSLGKVSTIAPNCSKFFSKNRGVGVEDREFRAEILEEWGKLKKEGRV